MKLTPTGRFGEVSLEGMLIALDDRGEPVMVKLTQGGASIRLMPVFATIEELRATMLAAKADFDRVVEVQDHASIVEWFLGAAAAAREDGIDLRLVTDLRTTPEGTTRFVNLIFPPEYQA